MTWFPRRETYNFTLKSSLGAAAAVLFRTNRPSIPAGYGGDGVTGNHRGLARRRDSRRRRLQQGETLTSRTDCERGAWPMRHSVMERKQTQKEPKADIVSRLGLIRRPEDIACIFPTNE
jgi:hypothetical protein